MYTACVLITTPRMKIIPGVLVGCTHRPGIDTERRQGCALTIGRPMMCIEAPTLFEALGDEEVEQHSAGVELTIIEHVLDIRAHRRRRVRQQQRSSLCVRDA